MRKKIFCLDILIYQSIKLTMIKIYDNITYQVSLSAKETLQHSFTRIYSVRNNAQIIYYLYQIKLFFKIKHIKEIRVFFRNLFILC